MGLRLIKTDKNGTKYWEDDRCPKCGGTGYIECYAHHDGGICYQCSGSGSYLTTYKEYTPEFRAKLDEKRQARNEKRKNDFAAHLPEYFKELGLTAEGHCFIVLAKTMGRSEELKTDGARFNGSWWYLDHASDKWNTTEWDASKVVYKDLKKKCVRWFSSFDYPDSKGALKYVVEAIMKERRQKANETNPSEFYGAEGDKVQVDATLEALFRFDSTDWRGNDCTKYGYKFADDAGHHFVWITEKCWWDVLCYDNFNDIKYGDKEVVNSYIGKTFALKGSVKAHKEREGLKETVLTRCKILVK